jgi:8-oxo-dGTP pyrophosphatase MutT (NUDIX family)
VSNRRGAVAVVIRRGQFLVIRRSRSVVAPLAYCFPGGAIEPGESEEQAVLREFREELCVEIRPLRHLWRSVTSWGIALTWWLGDLPPDSTPVANPAEVESVHWCTPQEMLRLPGLLTSNRDFLDAIVRQEIDLAAELRDV